MAGSRSARALVVELVADVTDFVKGTQKADDALSDFVGDAGRDLDDLARDTDRATEKMERSYESLAREARRSFDKIDKDADGADVRGKMGEFGSEAGSEFAQNMGEGISSGDFSGVATGTAGGLAASFSQMGPVGIVAGIGLGMASVMFTKFTEESKKRAEQVANLVATQMAGIVQQFEDTLDRTTAGENLKELIREIGEGDFKKGFDVLSDAANTLGLNLDQVLQGLQDGTLTTGDIATAFKKTADSAKATGAALAPAAKAQNDLKNAARLQAEAARQAALQTTIMSNAMTPAAAKAQQAARNTNQLEGHMHGAAGESRAMAGNLDASLTSMRLLNLKAIDLDRNMANVARNSSKTAENMAAAAGTSLGGRNLL